MNIDRKGPICKFGKLIAGFRCGVRRLGKWLCSKQFRQNTLLGFLRGFGYDGRELHGDGLPGIDGDGVEHDVARSALHVERIEQIFHADVVRGERGRVILRKARRGAGDGAGRVAVGCGVDENDAAGVLERLEEDEAAGAAVKTFDACRQGVLFEARTTCTPTPSSPMMTLPRPRTSVGFGFIRSESNSWSRCGGGQETPAAAGLETGATSSRRRRDRRIAFTTSACLPLPLPPACTRRPVAPGSDGRTSIHRRSRRWCRGPRCSRDRS